MLSIIFDHVTFMQAMPIWYFTPINFIYQKCRGKMSRPLINNLFDTSNHQKRTHYSFETNQGPFEFDRL